MKSLKNVIDEYCIEKYGHRDWDYLRTGNRKFDNQIKRSLKGEEHTIEDGIIIWHALDDLIEDLKNGRFGLKH